MTDLATHVEPYQLTDGQPDIMNLASPLIDVRLGLKMHNPSPLGSTGTEIKPPRQMLDEVQCLFLEPLGPAPVCPVYPVDALCCVP
jgi:hypothetical protein